MAVSKIKVARVQLDLTQQQLAEKSRRYKAND